MSKAKPIAWALGLLLGAGANGAWAYGDDEGARSGKPEQLGKVNFPVSCTEAAQ